MTTGQGPQIQPRPSIRKLPAYNAGISVAAARMASGRDQIAALASNENPYGSAPGVALALAALATARYSDSASVRLREALAARLQVGAERLVCGNGSEELIAATARAYLGEGDRVLTVSPFFGLHEIEPLAAGADVVKVPMTVDFCFDVDRLVTELASAPKIFFLATPSNPVGVALKRAELDRLIAAARPETLLVLDEAYLEFLDPDYPDGLELLKARPDLSWIVLRTFSKAYGLAGLRVGYGIASHDGIARALRSALTPFNVNAAAQAAAVAALEDQAWMSDATARIRRDRQRLADRLAALGLRVIPSQTNFLFVDVKTDAAEVAKALLARGIIVKPWLEKGYTRFLRVSIGVPQDNDRFATELADILALS